MKKENTMLNRKEMHPEVTPDALDRHIAMQKRAQAMDREKMETIRTIPGINFLMPLEIYKNVTVRNGKIEIAGQIYQKKELDKYDQQEITVREFENGFVLHEKTGKYIASIKKMHPEINQDALDYYISLHKKYLEREKKKMNINLSIRDTIS